MDPEFFFRGRGKVYLFLPGGTRIFSITLDLLFLYINVRKINVNLINLKGAGGGSGHLTRKIQINLNLGPQLL